MNRLRLWSAATTVAATLACTLTAAVTEAAPVKVIVTGVATQVGPTLDTLGFAVGDTLTVTYQFDDALIFDTAADPSFGNFPIATGSMTVSLGGHTASVDGIGIAIDAAFHAFSFGNSGYPMISDLPAPYQVQGLSFFVEDPSHTNITSDAFVAAPDFSLPWDNTGFTFFVDMPLQTFVIGKITGARVVPEPGTFALLAAAAAGLLARRRRLARG